MIPSLLYFMSSWCWAINIEEPGAVHFIVQDESGRPISGAKVTLVSPKIGDIDLDMKNSVTGFTDKNGIFDIEMPHPEGTETKNLNWTVLVHVGKEGYFQPYRCQLYFEPGLLLEPTITLLSCRSTLLRILGVEGQPLRHLRFVISYIESGYGQSVRGHTNDAGEYTFLHPPIPDGFNLSSGHWSERFQDAPIVTARVDAKDFPRIAPVCRLEGKLVKENGTPAADWFAAGGDIAGITGVTNGFILIHHCALGKPVKTGADGSFTIDPAENILFLFSSQGVPFSYPLNPESWPEGVRHLTLAVPSIRRIQEGQLFHQDGKPASNLEISKPEIRSHSRYWSFEIQKDSLPRHIEDFHSFPPGALLTNADGRYSLPQYFGSQHLYRPYAFNWFSIEDLAETSNAFIKSTSIRGKPSDYKRITLVLKDKHGEPVSSMESFSMIGFVKERQIFNWGGGLLNSYKRPGLVENSVTKIKVTGAGKNWNTWTQWVDVSGHEDRTLEVTVPETARKFPLSGRVLDPDEQPVPGANVIVNSLADQPTSCQNQETLKATTDEKGLFRFDGAPDQCYVSVQRGWPSGLSAPLPGWADDLLVGLNTREVVIKLQRAGSLKVLLPPKQRELPKIAYISSKISAKKDACYSLSYDEGTRSFYAPFVRPGDYSLILYDKVSSPYEGWEPPAFPIKVEPGKEQNVSLPVFEAPIRPPPDWIEIQFKFHGQPVSGVVVKIFMVLKNNQDTYSDSLDLSDSCQFGDFNMARVAWDLTSDDGRVRFRGRPDRTYFAIGRVSGKFFGWKRIDGQSEMLIQVEMQRTRAFSVRLNNKQMQHKVEPISEDGRQREVWVRFKEKRTYDETLAIFKGIGLLDDVMNTQFKERPGGKLRLDTPQSYWGEDFPVENIYIFSVLTRGITWDGRRWNSLFDKEVFLENSENEPVKELSMGCDEP